MNWRILKKEILERKGLIFLTFFFNLLAALLEGLSFSVLLISFAFLSGEFPTFILKILPERFFSTNPTVNFLLFISFAIVLQLLRSLSSYLGQLWMSHLSAELQTITQKKIYEQIFRFSYPFSGRFKIGNLMHAASSPPYFFSTLTDSVNRIVIQSLMALSYVCLMLWFSPLLSLLIFFLFILTGFFQKTVLKKIVSSSSYFSNQLANLHAVTEQHFAGLKQIHLFQQQKMAEQKISTLLDTACKRLKRHHFWNYLISPINETTGILLAGVTLILGYFFLQGDSRPLVASLLTFLLLTYRLGSRIQIIIGSIGAIAHCQGSLKRVWRLLSLQKKSYFSSSGKPCPAFREKIQFEEVSFIYPRKKKEALQNLSFTLSKGKMIAVIGVSGAGKSTLLDLLLRLYDPTKGKISIEGVDSREIDLLSWRKLFGVVSQDCFLFHDTIEENIRFGRTFDKEQVERAAQLACAADFIHSLPQGFQTVIGERGYRLSGGERQRLCLARALLANPPILVLDEATSNLDSESESLIQKEIEVLQSTKTLLVVTHRLLNVTKADEIYLIDKGKVIEKGSHASLIEQRGKYFDLWKFYVK